MFHVSREKLLQAAVKSMDDLIFIFDTEGNFADVFYPKVEELFMKPEQFLKKNYKDVLPPYLVIELDAAFSSLRGGSNLYEFRYKLELHGEKQWYHGKMTHLFSEDGTKLGFMGDMRRITRMVELEEGLLRKEKMLSAVATASSLLLNNSLFHEAINKGLRLIGQAAGVDRVYLFQNGYDPLKGIHFCSQKFEWSAANAIPQIDNPDLQEIPFDDVGPFVYTLRNGKPFAHTVSDLEDGRTKDLLQAQDILSILVFPILVNDDFWGFIGFDDCQFERVWDQAEYQLLKSYAHSLSSAIERESQVLSLKESRGTMEELNQEKSLLLTRAVAELSLPLKKAICETDLLSSSGVVDSFVLGKKQAILQELGEAVRIIQGLDDYVKMDPHPFSNEPVSTPWMNWVNAVKDSSASFLLPHKLHVQLDNNIPEHLQLNADRLKKVLMYLINSVARKNASQDVFWGVKKSAINHVFSLDFEIKACPSGTNGLEQRTFFSQHDRGIPSGYLHYSGEEIDLMVVNRLLQKFGASLHTDRKGLAFYFQLPLESAPVYDEMKPTERASEFDAFRGRMMVIEDNELNMFITSTLLQTWMPDATIVEVFNAYDALSVWESQAVDMVFIDIELPQRNGYNVAKKIRQAEKRMGVSKEVPIVALTGRYLEHEREEGLAAGMSDFLAKPIDAAELRSILTKYILSTM